MLCTTWSVKKLHEVSSLYNKEDYLTMKSGEKTNLERILIPVTIVQITTNDKDFTDISSKPPCDHPLRTRPVVHSLPESQYFTN